MIRNRLVHGVHMAVYGTLAFWGILGSLGYPDQNFNGNFYVYYTNLSNYLCFGVVLYTLICTLRDKNGERTGLCTVAPVFRFLCVILLLVTGLVYNALLAKDKTAAEYFLSPTNLILHLILPLMFLLDWLLFCRHGALGRYHPLLSTVMPLVYVAFILIRAPFVDKVPGALVYPYFFLNVDALGWGGLFLWLAGLLAFFLALSYLLFCIDRRLGKRTGECIR